MEKDIKIEVGEDDAKEAYMCHGERKVYRYAGSDYEVIKFDPHTPWNEEFRARLTLRRIYSVN